MRSIFFNRAQIESMIIGAKNEYIIGGRGLGKSEGFDARVLLRNIFAMPRSAGALLSPSYTKLKTQTFPAIANALSRWGYAEGIHYYVGRRPPNSANFPRPIISPFDWGNVISFFTGAILHMVSFDRPMSTNSLSLDYVIGPEARFLSHAKIVNEVTPAIRGNRKYFKDCPWHGGAFYSTDMPSDARGSWILAKEKDCDPELIAYIRILYAQMKQAEQATQYADATRLRNALNAARSKATFFKIYSALDNLELLGEEWFSQQERDLPPHVFQTSILSLPAQSTPNAFYPSFDAVALCYEPKVSAYAEQAAFTPIGFNPDCRWDGDIEPDLPLEIALDYNISINTLVVGQRVGREMRTLRAMWVKSPQTLEDLIGKFVAYYAFHPVRDVVYYYDATAVARAASTGYSYSDMIIRLLEEGGFSVTAVHLGRPIRHDLKFNYINSAFRGDGSDFLSPRFNSEACDDLITAIELAGSVVTRRGFGKDKNPEKRSDTPEFPDQHKTHITDAWDSLFIGMNLYAPSADGEGVSIRFS